MPRRVWVDPMEARALLDRKGLAKAPLVRKSKPSGQHRVLALVVEHSPTRSVNPAEWEVLSVEYDLPRKTNCEACGQSILNVARIAVVGHPERQIHLGLDCFDILQHDWFGLRIPAPVPRGSATAFERRARSYYVSMPGVAQEMSRPGFSWAAWLLVQGKQRGEKLPMLVRIGIEQLRLTRMISDLKAFAACREYVNNNRLFDARVVLGADYPKYGIPSSMTQMTIARALELRAGPVVTQEPPVKSSGVVKVEPGGYRCSACDEVWPYGWLLRYHQQSKFCPGSASARAKEAPADRLGRWSGALALARADANRIANMLGKKTTEIQRILSDVAGTLRGS